LYFFVSIFRAKEWTRYAPGACDWGGLTTDVDMLLYKYRSRFEKYVLTWDGEGNGTYYEDWTDYLNDEPSEGYDSDGDHGRHAEVVAEYETAAHIQRAALLATEHARFMAWLAKKGKGGLYEDFEKVVRKEWAQGKYPGAPVRDLPNPRN
jgi:hypothetical protein